MKEIVVGIIFLFFLAFAPVSSFLLLFALQFSSLGRTFFTTSSLCNPFFLSGSLFFLQTFLLLRV